MRHKKPLILVLTALAAITCVTAFLLLRKDIAIQRELSLLRSRPEYFKEALREQTWSERRAKSVIRFVESPHGAARLVELFLTAYEKSCDDMENYLDSASMVVGLLGVKPNPTSDTVFWEFPLGFVNTPSARLRAGSGQYAWRISRKSLLPDRIVELLPHASDQELLLAERPGLKVRVLATEEAARLCHDWPDSAKNIFLRKGGMPSHVCLLNHDPSD